MATNKPRITITFEQDTYDAVKEFAALTGMSMSRVVSEMTDQSRGSLVSTSVLLRRAKNAPAEVLASIAEDFENAASILAGASSGASSDYEDMLGNMGSKIDGADDAQPPYINKGVRSNSKIHNISNGGASGVSGHYSGEASK